MSLPDPSHPGPTTNGTSPTSAAPPARCLVVAGRQGRVPAALLHALQSRRATVRVADSLPAAMVDLAREAVNVVIVVDPLVHPSASRQMEFIAAVHDMRPGTTVCGFTQRDGQTRLEPLDRVLGPDGLVCRWRSMMVAAGQTATSALNQPVVSEQELAMLLSTEHNSVAAAGG